MNRKKVKRFRAFDEERKKYGVKITRKINPNTFQHTAPEFPSLFNLPNIHGYLSGLHNQFIQPLNTTEERIDASRQVQTRVKRNVLYFCELRGVSVAGLCRILGDYGVRVTDDVFYRSSTYKYNRHYSLLFINTLCHILNVPVALMVGIDLRKFFPLDPETGRPMMPDEDE